MEKSFRCLALILLLLAARESHAEDSAGKLLFNNHCRTCHSIKPRDNRVGPSLYGIYGAQAGQVESFHGYSGGLQGFVWTEKALDRFIKDPTSFSPSTYMVYPPVTNDTERHLIIEHLKSK